MGWINCLLEKPEHRRENCYTMHHPCEVISLYSDVEMTRKRYDIRSDIDYGVMLRLVGQVDEGVLEVEYAGEKSYCKVGDLYTGISMPDEDYDIYENPEYSYRTKGSTLHSKIEISIMERAGQWLKIKFQNYSEIETGWVPIAPYYEYYDDNGVVNLLEYKEIQNLKLREKKDSSDYPVYAEPDSKSEIVGRAFYEWLSTVGAIVLDAEGEWLKVRAFVLPDSFIEGWIPEAVQNTCVVPVIGMTGKPDKARYQVWL